MNTMENNSSVYKRFLKALAFVLGFCVFPIIMVYQTIEFMFVASIYWIITGKRYYDKYELVSFIWQDLMCGERKLKDLTFKRSYNHGSR